MNAQVILIAIGALFFLIAVVGSADSVQLRIAHLPTPARVILGVVGCIMLILAFTPIIKPTSTTSVSPSLPAANSTGASQRSAGATPSPNSVPASPATPLAACENLAEALTREASAIRLVNSNVVGSATKPTVIEQPGYNRAKAKENVTNQAAQSALGTYISAGESFPLMKVSRLFWMMSAAS